MTERTATLDREPESSKWMILGAVMLGVIMGPIDGSIVNVVLPSIADYFHADYSLAQWIPTIYLLAICSFILFYGRLGDIFGYKVVFLAGLICFALASLLCGLSLNIWMLIFFRAIQGLMIAMQMALGMAIVTSAFPPQERGKAIGIYATAIALGLMMGPVLGGIIAQYFSWRFIFFINLPVGVVALALGYFVIPSGERKSEQQIDLLGALLGFTFLFCLLLYANRSESWGWFSPVGIGLLIGSVFFGWLFFRTERRSAYPMLNLSIFKKPPVYVCLFEFVAEFHGLVQCRLSDALVPQRCFAVPRSESGIGDDDVCRVESFCGTSQRKSFRSNRVTGTWIHRNVHSGRGIDHVQPVGCARRDSGCGMAVGSVWSRRRYVSESDE